MNSTLDNFLYPKHATRVAVTKKYKLCEANTNFEYLSPVRISFDLVQFDTQKEFDLEQSRFTANSEGIYSVSTSIGFQYHPYYANEIPMELLLKKNDQVHTTIKERQSQTTMSINDLLEMKAGDYLELFVSFCRHPPFEVQVGPETYMAIHRIM